MLRGARGTHGGALPASSAGGKLAAGLDGCSTKTGRKTPTNSLFMRRGESPPRTGCCENGQKCERAKKEREGG